MDVTKKVSLKCGVCGNTSFEYDNTQYSSMEEAKSVKCTVCKKIYTTEELQEVNRTAINNAAKELAKEALEKELRKSGLKFKMK